MGSVYHAIDENLGVKVAVKENLFLTDEYARQFQREASILANLRHPNLPRVGDYFTIPNQGQYLIMDYIEGEDLRERIERTGTLTEQEVALIGAAICDALTYLHTRRPQVIHRDIKPGNIKITPDGEIVLVDFGLAKVVQFGQKTNSGARAMTPGYSPPEQYGTAPTDARSDIYSLGATLYAALTGSIPEDALARATGRTDLTGVRDLSPKTSRKIAGVIERALAIEPEDRYQSAEEMKKALLLAANISRNPEDKILVSPPPTALPGQLGFNSQPLALPENGLNLVVSSPAARPYRRRKNRLWPLLMVLVLILIPIGLFLAQPSWIPSPVAAILFTSESATPTVSPSLEPLATNTNPAVALAAATPTITQAAGEPEPTPTAEITAAGLLAGFDPTPTPLGGGQSEIAFSSDRSGVMQVWLMNADGSNQRQLTDMADGACLPAWSPDGQTLAFISPCTAKREIYAGAKIFLWNPDGDAPPEPLPLPASPAGDFYPTFSPDGKQIAFTTLRGPQAQIMVFDLETKKLNQITDGRHADLQPAFSPDGSQIAFVRKFAYTQIWLIGRKGEGAKQFSPTSTFNHHLPAWSPDGEFLFASQFNEDVYIPWLVAYRHENRQAAGEMRIPPLGQPDIGPVVGVTLSSDGGWIAYESWPDGQNHDIYLMTVNGASRTRLTDHPGNDFSPAWRP